MLPVGTCGEASHPSSETSKCSTIGDAGPVSSGEGTSTSPGSTSSHMRVYARSAG